MLPEHDVVVVDEAHELVDRVTGVATDELTLRRRGGRPLAAARRPGDADRLPRRRGPRRVLAAPPEWDVLSTSRGRGALRGARRRGRCKQASARTGGRPGTPTAQGRASAGRRVADTRAGCSARSTSPTRPPDVVWLVEQDRTGAEPGAAGRAAVGRRAAARPAVRRAARWCSRRRRWRWAARSTRSPAPGSARPTEAAVTTRTPRAGRGSTSARRSTTPRRASSTSRAPPAARPRRPAAAYLDEIAALVEAAGGRTLGLFSSMRAAKQATEALRERLDVPLLCQGDDATMLLVKRFAEDEPRRACSARCRCGRASTCPGRRCQLVMIDRIPFPRPDDPLVSARAQAVADAGGNGFMTVSGHPCRARLAQGAGRLLRRSTDRGGRRCSTPGWRRPATAAFLRASLPPFWATTDHEVAVAALRRLSAEQDWPPGHAVTWVRRPRRRGRRCTGPAGWPRRRCASASRRRPRRAVDRRRSRLRCRCTSCRRSGWTRRSPSRRG